MKRFRFGLEPALQWRELVAEQEKTRLQGLFGEESQIREQRQQVQDHLDAAADLLAMSKAVDASDLGRLAQFQNAMRTRDARLAEQQTDCRDRIVSQQQRCLTADRDEKLLQRLKEKKHAEWRRGFDKEADEHASESFLASWTRSQK